MTVATELHAMSYAEYLAAERTADRKHEYVGGRVLAMAGGTPEHARLQSRVSYALETVLAGRPCAVFSSDLRVRIEATGRSTYPDVTVVCQGLQRASDDPDAVTNPSILVEVLSETTESDDRGSKWAHYQRLTELREYVLVAQIERRVEVFHREGASWTYRAYGSGERAELPSVDAAIDVDALYVDPLAEGR